MQGRHHLQHCAVRFFVPLKKLGVCSAQFLTEPLGTNSGAFRFAKLHCSSDARLRRLSFGKYLSPGSTDILRENSLRSVPPEQPFASSHIKPIYYIRFFLKLQLFFGVVFVDFSRFFIFCFVLFIQKRGVFSKKGASEQHFLIVRPSLIVQFHKATTTRNRVFLICLKQGNQKARSTHRGKKRREENFPIKNAEISANLHSLFIFMVYNKMNIFRQPTPC